MASEVRAKKNTSGEMMFYGFYDYDRKGYVNYGIYWEQNHEYYIAKSWDNLTAEWDTTATSKYIYNEVGELTFILREESIFPFQGIDYSKEEYIWASKGRLSKKRFFENQEGE